MYDFLNDWMQKKRWGAVFVLARYLYRVGEEPLISDVFYDKLSASIKERYYEKFKDYLERTYDEDPIPYELLKEIGMEPVSFTPIEERRELYAQLDEDKSLSINSVISYEEAFTFFKRFHDLKKDLIVSLKMDGINEKMLFVDDTFKIAVSRARSGEGFDFTDTLKRIIPNNITSGKKELKVTGEGFVLKEGLSVLRNKYANDRYKTSKSSAISMLRVQHDVEDYKYLKTKVFAAEGLADTLEETYKLLASFGFDVVPYVKIEWSNIPGDVIAFKPWLKEVFDRIYADQRKENMPADGVVVAVNDLLWEDTITAQYSDRQIACKFEYWKFDLYRAKVTAILTEQRRVFTSVKVRIEPMVTSDDCEARVINVFNPSILIKNDIRIGTEVYFERNSGAVNILVHGKRLDDILKE